MPAIVLPPGPLQLNFTYGVTYPQDLVTQSGQANSTGQVPVTVNEPVESPLTIEISGAPTGIFTANLISAISGGHSRSGASETILTVVATTDGSEVGEYSSPILPSSQLSIAVSVATAGQTAPAQFQGVLNVGWNGGSASIGLLLYVSQITPSVAVQQPIQIEAGDQSNIPIDIAYASYDPAVLQVNVAIADDPSAPTQGLTIGSPQSAQLSPFYITETEPKQPITEPTQPIIPLPKTLDPERFTNVSLPVSVAKSAQPGNASAYFNVTSPNFPQLDTGNYEIKFAILPRPVTVTAPSLRFRTNASATLELIIASDGAAGQLIFGPPNTAAINIAWSNPYAFGGQNQSVSTNAKVTANTKIDQSLKVTVPYTAYNGLYKSEFSFEVTLLPYTDIIQISQNIPPGHSATGSLQLILQSNGNITLSGAMNRNETVTEPDGLWVTVLWVVTDSTGRSYAITFNGIFVSNWQFGPPYPPPKNCSQLETYWDDLMPGYVNNCEFSFSDAGPYTNPPQPPAGSIVVDFGHGGDS